MRLTKFEQRTHTVRNVSATGLRELGNERVTRPSMR
jgi:hypothetical protein